MHGHTSIRKNKFEELFPYDATLVIEEVRYDFAEFPRYAEDFIRDLLKLMIISKLNSPQRNPPSREYFLNLIQQVDGCEAYVVRYGQPLLYAKYHGVEFTDQKVASQFLRVNDHVIDVTMESVFGEFVKSFDSLTSQSETKVKWGIFRKIDSREQIDQGKDLEKGKKRVSEKKKPEQSGPDPMFRLLDAFIDSVVKLTSLDLQNPDSLSGKRFGIRNATIVRKLLHIEFLVDGQLSILALNPSKGKKENAVELLFTKSRAAEALVALMKQM